MTPRSTIFCEARNLNTKTLKLFAKQVAVVTVFQPETTIEDSRKSALAGLLRSSTTGTRCASWWANVATKADREGSCPAAHLFGNPHRGDRRILHDFAMVMICHDAIQHTPGKPKPLQLRRAAGTGAKLNLHRWHSYLLQVRGTGRQA